MKKLLTMIAVMLFSLQAQASLISVDLSQNTAQVGDTVIANIMLSDIETDANGFQKLLSAFSFDLLFDQNQFALGQVTFGNKLNVDAFLPSDQFTSPLATGVNFAEFSYAFFADLFTAQDGLSQFNLVTIELTALTAGLGQFSFSNVLLTDDVGVSFSAIQSQANQLNVTSTQVPEPATWLLLGLSLVALTRRQAK